MKKISAAILAITAVTMISCQRETIDSGTLTGEVEFTVTAGIPGGISTYADGVDAFSHNGGAVNVDPDKYDLRYILEVYTKDQTPVRVYRKTVIVPDNFTTTDVTITARLVAKTYDFVFWADFVENGSAENTDGLYYNTDPLTQVSYKDNVTLATLATEAIDAYCHVKEVDLSKNQNISGIKLHRPFGKIRLLATDRISDGAVQSEYPAKAKVDFKGATVPASFNVLTGLALEGSLTVENITGTSILEDASVAGTEYPDSYLLGYYYIFAADGSTSYAMDVTTYDQNGTQMGVRNLSQIPVQKNKLTTVIGNFYTNEGTLQIIVEDPFEEPETVVVSDGQSLADAINDGEPKITLNADIDMASSIVLKDPDIKTELDLNGNTLSFEANTLVNVAESEITFKNGTISAQNLPDVVYDLMAVGENGTIILDNVKFNTNGSGIGTEKTKNGGHIIIRNSEIQAVAYAVATNATLPVSQNVKIEITGSTLKGYTPLLINIPCDITVDDCNIIGTTQGTVFRGGTAKVINSSITLTYDDNDYEAIAAYFNNRNWGSGNMVNVAALTIGNKAPSAYQYPTDVTLENTELILAGAHGSAFPALYAYANDGEGLGVTLTYDEASKFGGDLVYGSENIVVNGKEVTPNEQ